MENIWFTGSDFSHLGPDSFFRRESHHFNHTIMKTTFFDNFHFWKKSLVIVIAVLFCQVPAVILSERADYLEGIGQFLRHDTFEDWATFAAIAGFVAWCSFLLWLLFREKR